MTAYGLFRKAQRVANVVASRKQARQTVLKRIRKQRAVVAKRLISKYGR